MASLPWLFIVGINENGIDGLSAPAREAISAASLVIGGKRHLALAKELIKGEAMHWPSPPHAAIAKMLSYRPTSPPPFEGGSKGEGYCAITPHPNPPPQGGRRKFICVLCTGDPFYYGMGAVIARHIPIEEMQVFTAPSIFSLVAAKMGWALQHTVKIGLNGRPIECLIPHLQPGARIIALSADEMTPAVVVAMLKQRGMDAAITLLEHVGGPQESIRSYAGEGPVARLNCMAIEMPEHREACLPITSGLADHWFDHDGQMTKREIRTVTLSALAMRKGELLWDIGLGSGSVAIEWLLCDPANRAIGFEKHPERAARAAANAKKLGVPQLVVLEGEAPMVLEGLEAPDTIFIGGGATSAGMLDAVWQALKQGGRLVMNAVSLETEALMLAAYKQYGGEMIRIAVERADNVGTMTGWRPAMTVTQWSITKIIPSPLEGEG